MVELTTTPNSLFLNMHNCTSLLQFPNEFAPNDNAIILKSFEVHKLLAWSSNRIDATKF